MSTIYGFLSDELFSKKININIGYDEEPTVCYFGLNEDAYFGTKAVLSDTRSSRNLFRETDISSNKMKVYFDYDKYTTDDIDINSITDSDLSNMFSILEYILLSNGLSDDTIENELTTNPEFNVIYVANSYVSSYSTTSVNIPEFEDAITLNKYFDIKLNIPNITSFRLWVDRTSFMNGYPLSTITSVILPCDYQYILDPTILTGNIDSIIKSSEFSFNSVDIDLNTKDQTGLLTYKTSYRLATDSSQTLPFGVVYKGKSPSTIEIRTAIREKLLEPGIASEDIWKERLPDLFVKSQYYIIPIWSNYVTRPEGIKYPSIISLNNLNTYITKLFPYLDTNFIDSYARILMSDYSEIFSLAISDPLNEDDNFDLLTLHPTYQNVSSQVSAFIYLDSETKEFSIAFNRCLSVLFGESTDTTVTMNTFDDLTYGSFTVDSVEYHVLTKESFNTLYEV